MLKKKTFVVAVALAAVLVGASACSGKSADGKGSAQVSAAVSAVSASVSAAGSSKAAESVFPVTVKHKLGTTTIKSAPQRVVALGYSDQDPLLALGVVPVMVREWRDMVPGGGPAGPWSVDRLNGAKPEILKELKVEAVAVMKPDLIVAVYVKLDKQQYEQLSAIAPVIVGTEAYPDYMQPWDVTTRQLGEAVGKLAEAEALVKKVNDKFDAVSARHPEWQGKIVTVAHVNGKDLAAYTGGDLRTKFFTRLGFVENKKVVPTAGATYRVVISMENAKLIDTDLLVWANLSYLPGGKDTITGYSALARLDVMTENRVLYPEGAVEKAFGWQTVLSLDYLLDKIEPLIAAAVKP